MFVLRPEPLSSDWGLWLAQPGSKCSCAFLQWQQLAEEKYLDLNESKGLVLTLRGDVLLFSFSSQIVSVLIT